MTKSNRSDRSRFINRRSVRLSLIFSIILFLGVGGVFLFSTRATQAVNGNGDDSGGTISGFKWEDVNGNGVKDDDEPALDGWTIRLSNGASVVTGDGEWPDGYYEFPELGADEYVVCEEIDKKKWTQTYPNENTEDGSGYGISSDCGEEDDDYAKYGYRVEIEDNEVTNLNFGNFEYGYISGHKYTHETGEPIEGWRIRAIYPDGSIRRRTTDENGYYTFRDLGPGTYRVCEAIGGNDDGEEVCIKGPNQASPDGYYTIEMRSNSAGLDNPRHDFTNYTKSQIKVFKFYDLNRDGEWQEGEPPLVWNFCLYKGDPFSEEGGPLPSPEPPVCKDTVGDGVAVWDDLEPGLYYIDEDERPTWTHTTDSTVLVEIDEDRFRHELKFGNWIEDENPPESSFNDPRHHQVIDTELLPLLLTGQSVDHESGVSAANLSIYQLSGPESVQNYPARSFFDVFVELECPIVRGEGPPTIPIEIVSLSLVSANPLTVTWGHEWSPPAPGIYCFEVKATDYAGNIEYTAWGGPLAYVPVVQISEQSEENLTTTSTTIEWLTDKPATSRVIYDTVPHSILGEAPNYGYGFSTVEQDLDPKIINHSVTITGLTPGTTYYYRTVSAASPEAVGPEQSFSTQQQSSGGGGGGGGGPQGEFINGPLANPPQVAGISTAATPIPTPIPTPTSTTSPQATLQVAGALSILPSTGGTSLFGSILASIFMAMIAAGALMALTGHRPLLRIAINKR